MAGIPVSNVCPVMDLLSINLQNKDIVHSTHMCNIIILGLVMILTGRIVPGLSMASLMDIHVLCKVGFTNTKCEVKYQNKVILHGIKDPTTNLWTLPITPTAIKMMGCQMLGKDLVDQKNPTPINVAPFTHSVRTHANAVKFAHQALCNPKISTLMKALKKGFLKGCPNISKTLVTKYLNPSPATAKGHMKCPKKGIHSTTPKPKQAKETTSRPLSAVALPQPNSPFLALFNKVPTYPGPAYQAETGPNITMDDEAIAIFFCFGISTNKKSPEMYTTT
jgi:hypothetical protein